MPLGLYLHVPFCARKCDYCAFYKETADRAKIELYLNAIEQELKKFTPPKPVETIFFGGGTPTLLSARDLDRLCGAVKKVAGEQVREWTIECAPATLKPNKLEVLKEWGVNRFSLGVQSFNEKTLAAIGRPHSLKQVEEAVGMLREFCTPPNPSLGEENNSGGFTPTCPSQLPSKQGTIDINSFNPKRFTWNIDLIFAAADITFADWMADLEKAMSLGVPHLSTYCLTFESDTEMFLKMLHGSKKKPTAEEEARFYQTTWKFLRGAGMHHYELANFARVGHECRHNLNTWNMGEWVGYGPSAASQVSILPSLGGGQEVGAKRFTNIPNLEAWAEGVKNGERALVDNLTLTARELATDAIVFGLRMPDGVNLAEIQKKFGMENVDKLERLGENLRREGYLQREKICWKLTDKGLLVADRVGLEVMSLA